MTVTPIVAPIERPNWVSAVPTPISRAGTEFWTASTKTCIIIPSPTPAMTMFRAASAFVVERFMRQSSSIPAQSTSGPTSTFGR